MATVTQTHREVALLVEREPRSTLDIFLRDVAQLDDYVKLSPITIAREVAVLDDGTTEYANVKLRDTAQLNDILTRSVKVSRDMREVAQLNDRARSSMRYFQTVTEVAQLNDNADGQIKTDLRDTALLSDNVVHVTSISRTIRETAQLNDRARQTAGLDVREVGLLDDNHTLRTRHRPVLRDSALLSDTDSSQYTRVNVLREVAQLSDAYEIRMDQVASIREVAYLSDQPSPPAYGRAYTCSVITWGMSTFSNYAFTTMAGKYAAGNNLWRLDAADDYGTPISSHITTGVMDMGAAQMKRLSAIYVAGSADEPLTVSVTGDVNGEKVIYDYELSLRDQTQYRNNRALIGKGFRSRYVQVKIEGVGIPYRLISADADVAVTQRRI